MESTSDSRLKQLITGEIQVVAVRNCRRRPIACQPCLGASISMIVESNANTGVKALEFAHNPSSRSTATAAFFAAETRTSACASFRFVSESPGQGISASR